MVPAHGSAMHALVWHVHKELNLGLLVWSQPRCRYAMDAWHPAQDSNPGPSR